MVVGSVQFAGHSIQCLASLLALAAGFYTQGRGRPLDGVAQAAITALISGTLNAALYQYRQGAQSALADPGPVLLLLGMIAPES
jgi:hypothetical protein